MSRSCSENKHASNENHLLSAIIGIMPDFAVLRKLGVRSLWNKIIYEETVTNYIFVETCSVSYFNGVTYTFT